MSSSLAAWTGISVCILLVLHMPETSIARPQENSWNDSLRFNSTISILRQIESTRRLLPNFNPRRDTAGFMLIPKYFEVPRTTYSELNPDDFVSYQKPPRIIVKADPAYPDSALRNCLEGEVVVKVYVGRDGIPGQIVVLKSDAEIFNRPAIDAARRSVFPPEYKDNAPVAAWLTCQFQFHVPKRN